MEVHLSIRDQIVAKSLLPALILFPIGGLKKKPDDLPALVTYMIKNGIFKDWSLIFPIIGIEIIQQEICNILNNDQSFVL